MQGLRIVCRDGSSLLEDEIAAAHRVVATFGPRPFGVLSAIDDLTGVRVEFHAHKNLAIVEPSVFDYRLVAFPCPWPGLGLSVEGVQEDYVNGTYRATAVAALSDGTILGSVEYDAWYQAVASGWDGTNYITIGANHDSHRPTVKVPFPDPPADAVLSNFGMASDPADQQSAAFRSAMLNRRLAWSRTRTSDTVNADLMTNGLWPYWDYLIKGKLPVSLELTRAFDAAESPLSESVTTTRVSLDDVLDQPKGPGQPFKRVTVEKWKRDVHLHFKLVRDGNVIERSENLATGYKTLTTTSWTTLSIYEAAYENWYCGQDELPANVPDMQPDDAGYAEFRVRYLPFRNTPLPELCDEYPVFGRYTSTKGTVWNGSETLVGGTPGGYAQWYGFIPPPLPQTDSTIAWTTPDTVGQYHQLLRVIRSNQFYAGPDLERRFLFTAAESSKASIILFSQRLSGQSFGMYWVDEWAADHTAPTLIDEIKIEGVISLEWDDEKQRFVPTANAVVPDPELVLTLDAPTKRLPYNALLRFSGLRRRDIRKRAKQLRDWIAGGDPAHALQVLYAMGVSSADDPASVLAIAGKLLREIGDI